MKIIKRDGRVEEFDKSRITEAIFKAAKAAGGSNRTRAEFLSNCVVEMLDFTDIPTVEGVQEIVEKVLIEHGHAKTAKAYILYRKKRAETRDFADLLVNTKEMVSEYLGDSTWETRENSNMDHSLQGLNNHIVSAVTKKYWLNMYPANVRIAHDLGDLHIHDLGLLANYCVGWDLSDILESGFRGAPGKVESGPPRHLRSALGQICNFLYTLQGESAGAQALSSIDTYLAPFIRADGLNYREVKQAMQEFIFNLNVPTRVGFQTPFVNFTFDITVPEHMKEEKVKDQPYCYGDYQEEMDIFNLAFCQVMTEGDARGRIFTFPIPTYNVTPDFSWDSPVVDSIMEMTARYGIPYFANFINSDLSPEDVRSMCCRLRINNRDLEKRGGGLFGANPLTGSIGVVTLNLPRIGAKSEDFSEFKARVKKQAEIAREALTIKRKIVEQLTDQGLYPYSRYYLRTIKESSGMYWSNHFSTIGIVGMHEALLNLYGQGVDTEVGRKTAGEILEYLREILSDFQEETGVLFNLEATPAEGASYRLALADRELYPWMISSGKDVPYYTNSTHLPVDNDFDIFEVLQHQDKLQSLYTGGTVLHLYSGELTDKSSVKPLLKMIFERYTMPYISFTPTFSICEDHGYLGGEQHTCPDCGKETEVWSRIVGYYRPVKNWNQGKKEEFKYRNNMITEKMQAG